MFRAMGQQVLVWFGVSGIALLTACGGSGGGGSAPPPPATYAVSVTVSGLTGSGLVLQNNGGDDLVIAADGTSSFTTSVADGGSYAVTVLTQPTTPNQICTVTNGSGNIAGADVTNVSVSCVAAYTVSVTASGVSGSGLVLQNNGGDDLSITGNGTFSFTTPLLDTASYAVTVFTQPSTPAQLCTVTSGTGTIAGADVTNVSVSCVAAYTVSVTASGLAGSGLVLQNNGGDDLNITADGTYSFATPLLDAAGYAVTVLSQPATPAQSCTVTNGAGTIAGADITNVTIACVNVYTVSGSVSGLTGTGLVLQNNGGNNQTITANGTFSFTTPLIDGAAYAVTILTQPNTQGCSITNGAGTIAGADVVNVGIDCFDAPLVTVSSLSGVADVSWNDIGATSYDLYQSTDPNCNFNNIGACAGGVVSTGATSPANVTGLLNGTMYYFVVKANYGGGKVLTSVVAAGRPDTLAMNAGVFALDLDASNTTYLGGNFTEISARTGGAVPLSTVNPSLAGNFPMVNGTVYAVASDGTGGWYIGGNFTMVGGVARSNLAHILADGTLDTVWAPTASGEVRALLVSAGTIYVGGGFISVNGTSRNSAAALDASGTLTTWAPNVSGTVYSLAISGSTVYLGGSFLWVNSTSRINLAAVDTAGTLLAWAPSTDVAGTVYTIAVSGNTVYVGGRFITINGTACVALAAIDDTGALTTWAPDVNGQVFALVVSGSTVYIGGKFSTVNGTMHNALAALDSTGALVATVPGTGNWQDQVDALVVSGGTVYAGGSFGNVSGVVRNNIVAVDSAGAVTHWAPSVGGEIYALAVSGNTVYTGGSLTTLNGASRIGLAAIDSTGALTNWAPTAYSSGAIPGGVGGVAVDAGTVYLLGGFRSINGTSRKDFAAIDSTTGALTSWMPTVPWGSGVGALVVVGGVVYVGGNFTSVNGVARSGLAAIDSTGTLTSWAPNVTGWISSMVVSGGTFYVGGLFTAINGTARSNLAAIDNTGALTTWAPTADSNIYDLAVSGTTVYVAGYFASVNGTARNKLAAIDSTGALTAWAPVLNTAERVYKLASSGGIVYVGGQFYSINGVTQRYLAAIDSTGSLVTTWVPGGLSLNSAVYALKASATAIYVGGSFNSVGSEAAGNFAVLAP